MTTLRFLPILLALTAFPAFAQAPSGETWFTIASPHFRVHHTAPLEAYARAITQALERALPHLEERLHWKAPEAVDVVVMDPTDDANGLAMNFPNTHIELFSAPFASDSPLSYYVDWANEIASHELTHIVANDTTLGAYKFFRTIFGSWVKPNGLQPVWISEGLAVFEETSLTNGGRGRSPFLDALLREAVLTGKLNDPDYTSLDRFNDNVPWWPSGNTPYLLGYAIQALPTKKTPNLPGRVSYENAGIMIFSPDRALRHVSHLEWSDVWDQAPSLLAPRYQGNPLATLGCSLTQSGRHTGGHALSPDGWLYFSEEDWNRGYHLARVRADAPCGQAEVERLVRKPYAGPSQVAVSPSGKTVAYSALDPGFESEFADLYLWSEAGGETRLTRDRRARDPAFLDENTLLYVKANPDTSESVIQRNLTTEDEIPLFTGKPLERISGLTARNGKILCALHDNHGFEKIRTIANGAATPLLPHLDPVREFERNPAIAPDGSVFFAAAYGYGPQEIYRLAPGASKPERVLAARSGFLDRPVLGADGRTVFAEEYGWNGIDIARAAWKENAPGLAVPKEDLHQFLTGEAPVTKAPESPLILPASVPYSPFSTIGTSMWPQYWFPELAFAQDGYLAGASTSGNDALEYHRYFGIIQYDSRAHFPQYRAFYHNRSYRVNFHVEANQINNYFLSSKASNRDAIYSAEALVPLWDFTLAFGGAYRDRVFFGGRAHNFLAFQNTEIDRSGKNPAAISPNWGASFNNFIAYYPNSAYEPAFVDERPELHLYFRGFHPSHSVSVAALAGISTNRLLTVNNYQGGGPSALSTSPYIVRGYANDALFGQRIATLNLAYTLPLAHPYRGLGTLPVFLTDIGLRALADAGTATYTSVYSGDQFLYYEKSDFGKTKLYGTGLDFIAHGSIFYHVPVSTSLGLHYGTEKRYGGGFTAYFGLSLGLDSVGARRL